jgi:DNA ligase-associated metallophosphoesterase
MRSGYLEIVLQNEVFCLLPQKAIYRPSKNQLILADLHLGKVTHFRKKGIALPLQSHLKDLDLLHSLLNHWQPGSVIILGDLFHSDYNKEWLWFKSLLMHYPAVQFILIEGNHDILHETAYALPNLIKTEIVEEGPFIFSHHPLSQPGKINFCGHIHPGIKIFGMAKQAVTLACFCLRKNHFILPAFGHLTGLQVMEENEETKFYPVAHNRVVHYK